MKIIKAYPPLYPMIDAAFNLRNRTDVIFSWGDKIFAPGLAGPLSPALIAHE